MNIKLQPKREDSKYIACVFGEKLVIDYVEFDFSKVTEGSSLPISAISCNRFSDSIERKDGILNISMFLPHPVNYSQEQAFPNPIINPEDGQLNFPLPLPNEDGTYDAQPVYDEDVPLQKGIIDWSQLITREMKDAQEKLIIDSMKAIIEDQWRIVEMELIADQLIAIEDDDPSALPGTIAQWRAYRTKVRAWKEGNVLFPNSSERPTRPTEE